MSTLRSIFRSALEVTSACGGLALVLLCLGAASIGRAAPQLERLGRGVVAIRTAGGPTYVSWRMLGTDPASVAFHLSDLDPDRPGLEIYGVHETPKLYGPFGSEMHDARTGQIIWGASGENADIGRGLSLDIDPRTRGHESWASRGGLFSARGVLISSTRPPMINFGIWWDGDLGRELLDGTQISKWDWMTSTAASLFRCTDCASNNGTKSTPSLSTDILGDWRGELVLRSTNNRELRIYTTTILARQRLDTLMHDVTYRVGIAGQQSAYNQPPHTGFFLGFGMAAPPRPLAPR